MRYLAAIVFAVTMLTGFGSAQETVLGTISFFPTGSGRAMQATSTITSGGRGVQCAQNPIWRASDIDRGQNPTIVNTTFGPCAVDGVLITGLTLVQYKTGILLTIRTADGKCYSMMLVNSAGVSLTDLTDVGFKGNYSATSGISFNLLGNVQ
jgi:hypothetical protein